MNRGFHACQDAELAVEGAVDTSTEKKPDRA